MQFDVNLFEQFKNTEIHSGYGPFMVVIIIFVVTIIVFILWSPLFKKIPIEYKFIHNSGGSP